MNILFDAQDFVVVEKPHDVLFHTEERDDGNIEQGFVSTVREYFQTDSLYPVHRLDRVTSGLMLFAKTPEANAELSEMFRLRNVKKQYLAVSDKKPKKKQGLISGDMAKARGGSYKLLRTHENPAVTRFLATRLDNGLWVFLLKPETGKTHQLRVACKSLGSPILGDARYGGSESDRCYLHAYRLQFEYQNQDYDICAPCPGDSIFGLVEEWVKSQNSADD